MAARGSSVKVGGRGGPGIGVQIRIEGLDRTEQAFKDARRDVNARLREAIRGAGRATVLPAAVEGLGSFWGRTLDVRKDRTTVFIGSSLRGSMNRALGWFDFGGRRPADTVRRKGPHVIVNALQEHRPSIDRAIVDELKRVFSDFDTNF